MNFCELFLCKGRFLGQERRETEGIGSFTLLVGGLKSLSVRPHCKYGGGGQLKEGCSSEIQGISLGH